MRSGRSADCGPVFIRVRGRASDVLLSIEDYDRLARTNRNIADLLSMPGVEEIDFEPPRLLDRPKTLDLD